MNRHSGKFFHIIAAMAAVLTALALFCSCTSDPSKTTDDRPTSTPDTSAAFDLTGPLLCDWSDSGSHIEAKIEYEGWNAFRQFEDETQPKTKTVNILGAEITGTYEYTYTEPQGVICSEYAFDGRHGSFETDADGNVVGFIANINEDIVIEKRQFDWREAADKIMNEFGRGADLSEYRVSCKEHKYGLIRYEVTYIRQICGMDSYDSAIIRFLDDGSIHSFSLPLVGCLNGLEITEINKAEIERAVIARADAMIESAKPYFDEVKYDSVEFRVAKDENGRPVVETAVNIICEKTDEYGDPERSAERLVFISDTEGKAP